MTSKKDRDLRQKKERHDYLVKLLTEKVLDSQGAIMAEMNRMGFSVTQPSISRDLSELGVIKVDGRYLPKSALSGVFIEPPTLAITTSGPYLIVVRTKEGSAQGVAVTIDNLGNSEIAGCVAGDDTIFVALTPSANQEQIVDQLKLKLSVK